MKITRVLEVKMTNSVTKYSNLNKSCVKKEKKLFRNQVTLLLKDKKAVLRTENRLQLPSKRNLNTSQESIRLYKDKNIIEMQHLLKLHLSLSKIISLTILQ